MDEDPLHQVAPNLLDRENLRKNLRQLKRGRKNRGNCVVFLFLPFLGKIWGFGPFLGDLDLNPFFWPKIIVGKDHLPT